MVSWNSQCDSCKHYLGDQPRPRCEAFPMGIATPIIQNLVLHLYSIPGDKGIVWEPRDPNTPRPAQMTKEDLGI